MWVFFFFFPMLKQQKKKSNPFEVERNFKKSIFFQALSQYHIIAYLKDCYRVYFIVILVLTENNWLVLWIAIMRNGDKLPFLVVVFWIRMRLSVMCLVLLKFQLGDNEIMHPWFNIKPLIFENHFSDWY